MSKGYAMQIEHVIGLILVAVIFYLAAISIRVLELICHAPIHAILGLPTGTEADNVVGHQGEKGQEQALQKQDAASADLGHIGSDEPGPGLVGARSMRTGSVRVATGGSPSAKDIIIGVSRSVAFTGDSFGPRDGD